MAIAFYILFSSIAAWCVHRDVTYQLHKNDTPLEIKKNI